MDHTTSTWEPYTIPMEDQLLLQPSSFKPNYNYNHLDHPFVQLMPSSPKAHEEEEEEEEQLAAMKEMMFKIAAMQPVDIDPATIRRPKRRNVRISEDPQSVAARHRRERISEKIRILQRLVPGGTKMDTASMLDEAIRYVKFLKRQVRILQGVGRPLEPAAAPAVGASTYFFNDIDDHRAGDDQYPMCRLL